MRKFSRWMPPQSAVSVVGWFFFVLIWAVLWPILLLEHFAGPLRRHLGQLASDRIGEDIGTFARGFNRRTEPFDPWVVRATWDALTSLLGDAVEEQRGVDERLAAAGIGPDHPSLFGGGDV